MAKGITKERIVEAAFEVLDERGIDGVTVRAVADRLDVKAPALYWHVRNKQDLLDEMGTEIERRVVSALSAGLAARPADGTAGGSDWIADLRLYADTLRAAYLAHRDGARTFSGTRLTDPEVLRSQEAGLRRWTEAGRSLEDVVLATELVTAFVVGFVIEEQERAQSAEGRYDLDARDAAVGDDAPLTTAAGHLLFGDPDTRFSRQLDTLLAGVAAVRG